jgi:subtilase family serine protease
VAVLASNLGVVTTNPTNNTQTTGSAIGTSAAAPIWAGLVVIANQMSKSSPTGAGRVGNANAFLYSIGKNAAAYGAYWKHQYYLRKQQWILSGPVRNVVVSLFSACAEC